MTKCANCGTTNDELANFCTACGSHLSKNYFEVLGIPIDASYETIKKAYHSAANKCHPDKTARLSPDLIQLASLKMAQLNDIWEVLKDDAHRTAYIESLADGSAEGFSRDGDSRGNKNKNKTEERVSAERGANTNVYATAPWSRWLARTIDYTVFIAILVTLTQLLSPSLIAWFHDWGKIVFANHHIGYFLFTILFGFAACLCWIPIEALLLSTTGSTLGKWLLQVIVLDSTAEKLSYGKALRRSFTVWSRGMAYGVIGLSFVANYNAYKKLKNENTSYWDSAGDVRVLHEKIGPLRFTAALLLFVQSSFLVFIGWGTYQTEQTAPKALLARPSAALQPEPAASLSDDAPKKNETAAADRPAPSSSPPAEPDGSKSTAAAPAALVSAPGNNNNDTQDVAPAETRQSPQAKITRQSAPPEIPPPPSSASLAKQPANTDTEPPATGTVGASPPREVVLQQIPRAARTSANRDQPDDQPSPGKVKYRASREQVIACMETYFAVMHKASELPLGDYVRLNKQATREKERCLSGG